MAHVSNGWSAVVEWMLWMRFCRRIRKYHYVLLMLLKIVGCGTRWADVDVLDTSPIAQQWGDLHPPNVFPS